MVRKIVNEDREEQSYEFDNMRCHIFVVVLELLKPKVKEKNFHSIHAI